MSYLSKHACNNFSNYHMFHRLIRNNLLIVNQHNFFSFDSENQNFSKRDNSFFGHKSFDSSARRFKKQSIQWPKENLTPFQKQFYKEHPDVKKMSEDEVRQLRAEMGMMVFGKNVPKPFRSFHESGIPEYCLQYLKKSGIDAPTPIQQQGIPMALSGRDVIGISRTGSGKTLSYLLPCIVHIAAQPLVKRDEGPIALVLAPTRELACQIGSEIEKLVKFNPSLNLKYCTVYGGTDRHRQISALQKSPDIIIATPGRLMDLLESGVTNFKRTTYCVLDEADRMLDMGFRDDIETILSYVRPDKQVLMWSATWPPEIQSIALKHTNDPIRVQIGSTELTANSNIKQTFRCVDDERSKIGYLIKDCDELIQANKKILIFTNRKRTANILEGTLQAKIPKLRNQVSAIHGDKEQRSRENILEGFRSNDIRILIATDVVARGIDISDIDCIIIYDFPTDIESYVHRIGRTARGNKEGLSLAYLNFEDIDSLGRKLINVLNKVKQPVPKWLQSKSY